MKIFIKKENLTDMYTSNREAIKTIGTEYKLKNIRILTIFSEFGIDLLSSVVVIIFWCLLGISVFIYYLSFKYNFDDFCFKRILKLFLKIQILVLLNYCNTQFPSNLNHFIYKIYKFTVKMLKIGFFESEFVKNSNLNLN